MKKIPIYPLTQLERYLENDYNMFLTHLIRRYPDYSKIAKQSTGYKILDNSLAELGEAMSLRVVLDTAERIDADEIVLPDMFMRGEATLTQIRNSVHMFKEDLKKYSVMAVIHGETVEEVERVYQEVIAINEVDVLGIPKVWEKQFKEEGGRSEILKRLVENFGTNNKEIHLLGIWNDLKELEKYKDCDYIRSVDSSLFTISEMMNGKTKRPNKITLDLESGEFVTNNKIVIEAERNV